MSNPLFLNRVIEAGEDIYLQVIAEVFDISNPLIIQGLKDSHEFFSLIDARPFNVNYYQWLSFEDMDKVKAYLFSKYSLTYHDKWIRSAELEKAILEYREYAEGAYSVLPNWWNHVLVRAWKRPIQI